MPRERKSNTNIEDPGVGHNAINPDMVASFTNRIEGLLDELASAKGEYMRAARGIRDDINTIYGEAKDAGIPKRAFKAVIKARGLEKKLEACRGDLEEADDIESYDQIRDALGDLGDLPLGRAVLDRAPDRPAA
jgi:uncharacterized protein (UPF0335 family)